ncbi:hypothetical protein PC112_g7933 [Phytophthora cactorum]|nr:hypothetical protein PC112_g7933 [Phytophthora cactorum]
MKEAKVRRTDQVSGDRMVSSGAALSAQQTLLTAWFIVGIIPLILQTRSFLKFVMPHKITETLVVPSDAVKETTNMTELCPALGLQMAQVWWNLETTHYFNLKHGRLCHLVSPQYNCHGRYVIGSERTNAYHTAPSSCANDSFPVDMFFYHGSIGFYSFYEEHKTPEATIIVLHTGDMDEDVTKCKKAYDEEQPWFSFTKICVFQHTERRIIID